LGPQHMEAMFGILNCIDKACFTIR